MKKTSLLLTVIVFASSLVQAQPPLLPTDTITGRSPNHYYLPYWYDDCYYFQLDTIRFTAWPRIFYNPFPATSNNITLAEEHYALQPLQVTGVAVLVWWEYGESGGIVDNPPANPFRAWESVLVMSGDSLSPSLPDYYYPRYMSLIDSTRWDTAAAKLLRLPKNTFASPSDSSAYFQCYLYEAMFDHPVKVYDTFYIVGTYRSNAVDPSPSYFPGVFHNLPTSYFTIWAPNVDCEHCPDGSRLFVSGQQATDLSSPSSWSLATLGRSLSGPFLPIVRTCSLYASPSPGGTVSGTGRYPAGWRVSITATPNPGYTFSHWDDGSTLNPRTILLSSDTTLSASFSPL